MELDLQHIISSKKELLARGDAPRPAVNYTEDMSSDQKDRFVEYLIEQNEDQKLTIRAMQAVLEDFRKEQEGTNKLLADANTKVGQVLSQLEALQAELRKEKKERQSLERKNARLQDKLDFANKNRFGSKSQKVKEPDPAKDVDSPDRTKDEDNFDGTSGSISSEVNGDVA